MKNKTKNKLFHLYLLLTFIILFSIALAIQKSISVMNNSVALMGYQTENNERRIVRDELVRYASSVESDISQHGYGKNVPSSVFRKYMSEFSDKKSISRISIINVGYTFNDIGEDEIIDDICNKLPLKYHEKTVPILEKMISELKLIEKGETSSNTNVNNILETTTDQIVKLTHVNKQTVQNIMFKEIFVTNKMVMCTDNNDNSKYLSNTELDQILSNDSTWNEWIAIPKGYLGVGNEPSVDNGKPNLDYNKYIILVSLDRHVIMKDYDAMKVHTDRVSIILLCVLSLVSVLALSLCVIEFYKKINGGDRIEPIIRTNPNNNDDAVYKLFHRLSRKSK